MIKDNKLIWFFIISSFISNILLVLTLIYVLKKPVNINVAIVPTPPIENDN